MRQKGRAILGGVAALVLAACSPVRIFDAAMPKDGGTSRLVRNAAYGANARQRLDVYGPKRPGTTPLPIIIFFYGGSWESGTKDGYSFLGRALAARGFLVAIPDYRVLPQVQYPAFLEDNAASVRWVRDHAKAYGGDPDRLILLGHSAGAYDAAMLALDPRWLGADRPAVKALIGLAGPYDFLPLEGQIAQQTFGAVVDKESTQPVRYVTAGAPPAFLATAENDTLVHASNSDSLTEKLERVGVRVERRRYPAIGHAGLITAFARPLRGRASVLRDVVAFAKQAVE